MRNLWPENKSSFLSGWQLLRKGNCFFLTNSYSSHNWDFLCHLGGIIFSYQKGFLRRDIHFRLYLLRVTKSFMEFWYVWSYQSKIYHVTYIVNSHLKTFDTRIVSIKLFIPKHLISNCFLTIHSLNVFETIFLVPWFEYWNI